MIGHCPLCKSEGVEHPAKSLLFASASCSNASCILHIQFQDETNKHVRLKEWPEPCKAGNGSGDPVWPGNLAGED